MDKQASNPPTAELPQDAAPLAEGDAPQTAGGDSARNDWETIELSEPIRRGDTTIDALQLRKPKSGELRGLNLSDLIQSDISALLRLLPRITVPPLTPDEVDELAPEDIAQLGGTVRGFFMTRAEREMMDAMLAEQQPRS